MLLQLHIVQWPLLLKPLPRLLPAPLLFPLKPAPFLQPLLAHFLGKEQQQRLWQHAPYKPDHVNVFFLFGLNQTFHLSLVVLDLSQIYGQGGTGMQSQPVRLPFQ